MKRTSSMVYTPSEDADDLVLFTVNEEYLYRQAQAIVKNLRQKYLRGEYDADRAIDAFYSLTTGANSLYRHYFGQSFTVTERFTAAQDLRDYFTEDICQG